MWKPSILLIVSVIFAKGNPLDEIYNECGDSVKCAEEKIIKAVDVLDGKSSVSIFGDLLTIEKTAEDTIAPKTQEGVIERILRYFGNHELRMKVPSSQKTMRSLADEARKSKLKKIILPLLLLLKLKGAIVLTAILFGIALVAFKGMGAGFMALLISGAIGLKTLLEKHGSSSSTFTYEVVPQIPGPHWSRNGIVSRPEKLKELLHGYSTIPKQ